MQPVYKFVVHKHIQAEGTHWDLMLANAFASELDEKNSVKLATWKFDVPPVTRNFRPFLIGKRIFNHRKVYLEYEGIISNNRGRCEIFDRGTYTLVDVRDNLLKIHISGQQLKGLFVLEKFSGQETDCWKMTLLNGSR